MKRLKDENGQALIITALCMTCLFGFAALATDVGIMLREKRLLQIAADSAAIAGATELSFSSGSANVTSRAKAASAQNGFTDGTGGAKVTVNNPPLFGPHKPNANAVEVIISQSQPTLFMNFFGIASMTPTVRAVAVNGGLTSTNCVIVLDPSAAGAMTLQGSFTVTAPNCGVAVNSSSADGLQFTGGGGTLSAGSVGVAGGDGGQIGDSTPKPVTGIVPVSDPLASKFTPPDPTKLTCNAAPGGTLTGILSNPSGGVACYSGNVTLSNVTLGTGIYVFTGTTITLDSNVSTTSGSTGGSTIDINNGTLSINTGTVLNLTAPVSGTYNGVALMEPAANSNTITIQKGNATGTINGIIYAPSAQLFLQDSGGDKSGGLTLVTDLIVGQLFDKTATLSIQSYSQSTSTSPLTKVTLVE